MARLGRQRTAAQSDRMARIVELRRLRVPVTEIAAELGISHQRVSQIYAQSLREVVVQAVSELRAEETALTEDAVNALMTIARDESVSPRTRIEAWTSARGWAEHKARILGINAPVKVEVSDAVDAEIGRLAAELAAVEPGGAAEAAGHPAAGEERTPAP